LFLPPPQKSRFFATDFFVVHVIVPWLRCYCSLFRGSDWTAGSRSLTGSIANRWHLSSVQHRIPKLLTAPYLSFFRRW
jgi:hypothetical protein